MRKTFLLTMAALYVWTSAYGAQDFVSVDTLVEGLSGRDEAARVRARQLMPRRGIEALPKLIPLLAHEDPNVWRAALRVTADILNQAGMPGHEAERLAAAEQLMPLLAPDQPHRLKEYGLRLLPLAAVEGMDLAPVATLLADETYREKARAALVEINTAGAAAVLREGLEKAEEAKFQAALLDGLGMINDPANEAALLKWATKGTPETRVAALRGLARVGDLDALPLFQKTRAESADKTQQAATDALLRLLETAADKGGQWEQVMAGYRDVLASGETVALRGAALAGLGRFGDALVVADICAAATAERDLQGPALNALRMLRGRECHRMLLAAYPNQADDFRLALLDVFAEKGDALFLEILNGEARSENADFRRAAVVALGTLALPGAVDGLVAVAEKAENEEKALAVGALRNMAERLATDGYPDAAGKAYLALYHAAETDELRALGLAGLQRYPTENAFPIIMEHLDATDLSTLDPGIMAGIVGALHEAGRKEEGEKLLATLLPQLSTPGQVTQAVQHLGPMLGNDVMAQRLGVLQQWKIIGPFPWQQSEGFTKTHIGEPAIDLAATYKVGERELAWKSIATPDALGMIELTGPLEAGNNATAYAFARISVPEATDVVLRAGSDDGVKLWVNGEAVHENNVDRGAASDQDQAPANLRAGENDILAQITQGGGGWAFCLRITRADGATLPFEYVK
jgi:hypothetical protein